MATVQSFIIVMVVICTVFERGFEGLFTALDQYIKVFKDEAGKDKAWWITTKQLIGYGGGFTIGALIATFSELSLLSMLADNNYVDPIIGTLLWLDIIVTGFAYTAGPKIVHEILDLINLEREKVKKEL
jgi:hypothetical protein